MMNDALNETLATLLTVLAMMSSAVQEPEASGSVPVTITESVVSESSASVTVTSDDTATDENAPDEKTTEAATAEEQPAASIQIRVQAEGSSDPADASGFSTAVAGKVIVISPDGTRREFDLNQQLPEGIRGVINGHRTEMQGADGRQPGILRWQTGKPDPNSVDLPRRRTMIRQGTQIQFQPSSDNRVAEKRLMIGVHCGETDELLRAHLKLGESGLVVVDVVPKSPAAEAGLQKYDLLLRSGDSELKTVHDLLKSVENAGDEPVTLHLLRNGDPLELTVKPRIMEQPSEFVVSVWGTQVNPDLSGGESSGELPLLSEQLLNELKQHRAQLRLRQIPPGIMIERSLPQEEIQRLVDQAIKAAQDSSRKQTPKTSTVPDSPSGEADTQSEIKALKEQLSAVMERLNQLEQQK